MDETGLSYEFYAIDLTSYRILLSSQTLCICRCTRRAKAAVRRVSLHLSCVTDHRFVNIYFFVHIHFNYYFA